MAPPANAAFDQAPYEDAGPTMLAAQPPIVPANDDLQGTSSWGVIFQHLESRLGGLRNWRWSWWVDWAQLAKFILPRRYKWLVTANTMWRGGNLNTAIVDSTATLAMQICAAGLWTGLTSPSRPWFNLGIGLPNVELDADGKAWLEDTEERLMTVLHQSNFYPQMAQVFQDVATFGTSPFIIYEDSEDVIRLYVPCAGEYYLGAGARLSVDSLYREFTLTVAQVVGMFGVENCPPEIQKLWQTGGASWEAEQVVAHAIEPNSALAGLTGTETISVVPQKFPFREVYWLRGNRTSAELSRRGFNERPFMAARWSTVSNDAYGRGPGQDAIGDIQQIQLETRRKAEFIEKGVRPPMGANPELKNEPSSILPGNITYTNTADGKKGFWPLFEPKAEWLAAIAKDIAEVAERINRAFFVDIFMAISRMEGVQPRNQLELTKRDLERLQVLGPFINLFESEVAGPGIARVLAIMQRRRMLKPLPQSLRGVPLKINYNSIMKLAQRAAETIAIKDTLDTAGAMSAAAKAAGVPDPLRILDLDKGMRHIADLNGYPLDAVFTEEEVAQHDQAREFAQKQAQALSLAPAGVEAAKTLSDTNLGGDTALAAMLGQRSGA